MAHAAVSRGALSATIAGEAMLLVGRAMIWPGRRALIVADPHIGKAATFRASGLPVPHGTTFETLERLSALIGAFDIDVMYVLGDFLHSSRALPPSTVGTLRAWRGRHRALRIVLIRGNHDQQAGVPPADLDIVGHDEALIVPPFVLAHVPAPHPQGYVLAGHLHPAIRLSSRYDSLRLPCFWLQAQIAVLPAFGAFTGSFEVTPAKSDRICVVSGEAVFAVP